MSDYISREAAIEKIRVAGCTDCGGSSGTICGFCAFENAVRLVNGLPATDVEPVRHGRWIYSRKHLWYKDKNGEIDMWRLDIGFHNGPECQVCHASFCEHCTPNFDDEECDVGHYYCSECKAAQFDNHNTYCPNCGSKMDLEE